MATISLFSASILIFTMGVQSSLAQCVKDKHYGQVCSYDMSPYWWVGSWAYEERDQCGDTLLALLYMNRDGMFLKHIVAKDHSTRDVWGSYQIDFSPLELGEKREFVPLQKTEPDRINSQILTFSRFDVFAKYFYNYINKGKVVSSRYPQHGQLNVLNGNLTLKIEHKSPKDYDVGMSQVYNFITQGPGYMMVLGPGANGALFKKYSDHIISKES